MSTAPSDAKGGRPRKQSLRSKKNVYFDNAEWAWIDEIAAKVGLSRSGFIRRAVLRIDIRVPLSQLDREALREVSAVGNLLNQLTRAVHAGHVDRALEEDLRHALRLVTALVSRITRMAPK
jgi:hypothetical protein